MFKSLLFVALFMAMVLSATVACPADERAVLLDHRVGYGASAIGGYNGPNCLVTNLNDSGAGSLRACAEGNDDPKWIRFAVSGTITLTHGMSVGANKTIDGRGANITLSSVGNLPPILISGKPNIIVHNITLDDCGTTGVPDCILVYCGGLDPKSATDIWIDHVTILESRDEGLNVHECEPDMTVSWSKIRQTFVEHSTGSLLGSYETDPTTVDGALYTLHHNYWLDTGERHPKINRGKLHQFNDYITNWDVVGSHTEDYAQVLFENNVCEPTGDVRCLATNSPETSSTKAVGNLLLNGATVEEDNPSNVFTPPYSYSSVLEIATTALRDRIIAGAGRQAIPTW